MEEKNQTSSKTKEEEMKYYDEPGIDPEEAKFIANSLFIDMSPKNDIEENAKTESFEDGSISDCSSNSDNTFSKRMELKSKFRSGFDKKAIASKDIENDPVLTDFSCPIINPDDNKIIDDKEIETDNESLSVDDDTSDEDYVPEEDTSGSSMDDIIDNDLPLKQKVTRTQHKQKHSTKSIAKSSEKTPVTSISTNVFSFITSNASQTMNLSGKYVLLI